MYFPSLFLLHLPYRFLYIEIPMESSGRSSTILPHSVAFMWYVSDSESFHLVRISELSEFQERHSRKI